MCFDPDGKEPEACFPGGAPGADGSFELRGSDGRVQSSVRKVDPRPEMASQPPPGGAQSTPAE